MPIAALAQSAPGARVGGRAVEPIGARDLAGLPDPVVSYFRRAIPLGFTPPTSVYLEQTGEILVGRRWRAFTATEVLRPPPGGFVWDAAIHMAPFVSTRVRDSYEDGVGAMQATVARLFTVADARDGTSLNAGALHRYLAECVWLPTALLPRYAVMWSAIDATMALATLGDAGNRVSLEFTFTRTGEVAQIYTPARARAVAGGFEWTPWRVQMTRHDVRGSLRVPVEAQVEWEIDGVWEPCWRGRVGEVRTGD